MMKGQDITKPGSIIANRYEVLDVIGVGGMGTVLRVIDRSLENESLALKLLPPTLSREKTTFARFQNELLVTRKLGHPNIIRLYDFGDAGYGYYYFTMEYVKGENLKQRIERAENRVIPFHDGLEILYNTCLGLNFAHQMGVVHRDLKPDNILLTENGRAKISDFGLARSMDVEKGLTATGDTVGTPYYMAPEQLRGDKPDARVDIYALGILAFEMATGRKPFVDSNYVALAAMHFNYPIPEFAGGNSGIPGWFQDFVESCAEKKPNDRYQSMAEVMKVLYSHMLKEKGMPCALGQPFCPLAEAYGAKKRWFFF